MTLTKVWDVTVDAPAAVVSFGEHVLLVAEEWVDYTATHPGARLELRSAADGTLTRVAGTADPITWVCECEGGGIALGVLDEYPPDWEYTWDYQRTFTARFVSTTLQLGDPIEVGRCTMAFDDDRYEHIPSAGTFVGLPAGLTFTGLTPRLSQTVDGRVYVAVVCQAADASYTVQAVIFDADLDISYAGATSPITAPLTELAGPVVGGLVVPVAAENGRLAGLGPTGYASYRFEGVEPIVRLVPLPVTLPLPTPQDTWPARLTPQSFNTRLSVLGAPHLDAVHDWGTAKATLTFTVATPDGDDSLTWTTAASDQPTSYWLDLLPTGRDYVVLVPFGSGSGTTTRLVKITAEPPVLTGDFDGSRVHFIG